jgi:hypothetical protein
MSSELLKGLSNEHFLRLMVGVNTVAMVPLANSAIWIKILKIIAKG